jgi:hypothetical protein
MWPTLVRNSVRLRRPAWPRLTILLLVIVLAVPLAYGSWTVYENSIGPCSVSAVPASAAQAGAAPAAGSSSNALSPTAARALTAYGGETVWQHATSIDSTVTLGGLLFSIKGRNIPPHATIRTDIQRPHVEINPIDTDGDVGIVDGFTVTIRSTGGQIVDQVADARDHLQNQQLGTRWDQLNLVYFLGYAFWGYYSLPYQLTRPDIKWTELTDGVLQADYGPDLPVHSPNQRFYFDRQTGLLKRNDYIAIAAAPDAKVANVVLAYANAGPIPYPVERVVKLTPERYGACLPVPDVITIDVESWRLN